MLKKEIVIFGTGIDGLRCMDVLHKQYQLSPKYFIVNNCQQMSFAGYSVKECDKTNTAGKFILIATKEWTYGAIKEQLCSMGLVEFEHFIYYEWMFKKLVLLHGNCHLDVIESYLKSSREFTKRYSIYPNPRIYANTSKTIPLEVLQNVDLWIHQDIQDNNGYGYEMSDNYLRKYMKETAVEIVIPHLFGLGKILFPQSGVNENNPCLSNERDKNGMFPHADFLIEQCVQEGLSTAEIVEYCLNENALTEEEVIDNYKYHMDKIRSREENWDIKISEFISKYLCHKKLFYDMGHPTNVILEYITSEVLKKLGIKEEIYTDMKLDTHEVPVYPAVKKYLKLEWQEREIRISSGAKRIADEMNTEEYIKEYLYWCHQM